MSARRLRKRLTKLSGRKNTEKGVRETQISANKRKQELRRKTLKKYKQDKGFVGSEFATPKDKRDFLDKYDRPRDPRNPTSIINFPRLTLGVNQSNRKKVNKMFETDKVATTSTPFKSGGIALKGYGKAYMKGGKVK